MGHNAGYATVSDTGQANGQSVEQLPAIMTPAEAARHFKLSAWYLNELARQGKIPCIQFGRARRFITTELIKWAKSGAITKSDFSRGLTSPGKKSTAGPPAAIPT